MGFEINSTGVHASEPGYESDIQEEIIDDENEAMVDEEYESDADTDYADNEHADSEDETDAIDYSKNGAVNDEEYEEYKQIKPVIDKIKSDNTLQQYMRHSANGHSPDAIIDGMFLQRYPELQEVIRDYYSGTNRNGGNTQHEIEEEIPEFNTTAEEIQYYATKSAKQAIQEAMGALLPNLQQVSQKQQQYETQQAMSNIRTNNDTVLSSALYEMGLDPDTLGNRELLLISDTMKTLYPGADFKMSYISPQQAKHIVKASLSGNVRNNRASSEDYVKQSTLPRVRPTGPSRKNTVSPMLSKLDGFTKDQRLQRVNDLFN